MRINKFNIGWQIVRVQARSIKNIDKKIEHVMTFLNKNKNVHNYGRVLNWMKMTGVAYKDEDRLIFLDEIDYLVLNAAKYNRSADSPNDLTAVSDADLLMVYKDLSKRKYGFQFKSTPKAHTEFMTALEREIESRK